MALQMEFPLLPKKGIIFIIIYCTRVVCEGGEFAYLGNIVAVLCILFNTGYIIRQLHAFIITLQVFIGPPNIIYQNQSQNQTHNVLTKQPR